MEKAKQRYDEAKSKLRALQVENDEIQQKMDEIDGKIREKKTPQQNPITAAAEMMLAGKYKKPDDVSSLFEVRDDLAIRRKVLFEAIRLQEEIIKDARGEYSNVFGKSKRNEYIAIIRQTVKAVINLSLVVEREYAFRDEFRVKDVLFNIGVGGPLNFTKHGTLSDRNSRVSMYLREVIRSGLISEEEIKGMIRDAKQK